MPKKKIDDSKINCPEYNALLDGIEAAKEQVTKAGKTAVAALFKAFFAEYPTVTAVGWDQYAPHFNDGDACEFSVHEAYVTTEKGVDFANVRGLYDEGTDGFKDSYSLKDGPVKEGLQRLWRSMDDDIFEVAFGSDAMVIATPEGFHINECDHD